MKRLALAALVSIAAAGTAMAQTAPATGTAAPATTATTTTAAPAAAAGGDFVTLTPPTAGGMPSYFRTGMLDDEDVYGANNEKIGEIDDFVLNADGSVNAVIMEVGGFLGVGEKDVLVRWQALQFAMEGDDMRVTAPSLTRETLTAAPDTDLTALGLDD